MQNWNRTFVVIGLLAITMVGKAAEPFVTAAIPVHIEGNVADGFRMLRGDGGHLAWA
jgi:hypothetical protein